LDSDAECFVELDSDQGELSADIPKVDNQENVFRIHTPHTSAAVRGTRFDFTASDSDLVVGVTEGEVALISAASELALPVGFGIKAVQNTPVGEPIPLLPSTNMRSIPPRVAKDDLISAVALEGANSYNWRLTSDVSGNQVVDKANNSQPLYTINTTAAGEYYLQVRGVDSDGIKGFGKRARIDVAGIDDSFADIELEYKRNGQDVIINVVEPDDGLEAYEVQLSVEETFADPVSVDIGNSGIVIFAQQASGVFVRARGLIEPLLVTPFGPTLILE